MSKWRMEGVKVFNEKSTGRKYKIVESIDGLYDEGTKAVILKSEKKGLFSFFCRHEFINASLSQHGIAINNNGLIRYCRDCKTISCIHETTKQYYMIRRDKYYATEHCIEYCCKCNRRILTSGCGVVGSSKKAATLISKVTKELGTNTHFGFEFNTIVSQMIDRGEDAESYIKNCLHNRRFSIGSMKT